LSQSIILSPMLGAIVAAIALHFCKVILNY